MALVNADRVKETTTTTGTGALTLGGAVAGFQSFSAIGNGNTAYCCCYAVDANGIPTGEWETFLGTYTASGTTLARTTRVASSTGGAVNFSAGTKHVITCFPSTPTAQRASIGLVSNAASDIEISCNGGYTVYIGNYSGGVCQFRMNTHISVANDKPIYFDSDGSGGNRSGIRGDGSNVLRSHNGTTYGNFNAMQFEAKATTGTAPLIVASTTVVTNLNADKLDGLDATAFVLCSQSALTAAASVALDFASAGYRTLTTDQNTTFTTSNRAAGRQPYSLRIIGGGAHTLTFPAGWVWLNSTMPASIASGKTGRLYLECYGSADTDVVASYAVEA